ncbi:tetratricopeptide repeat protein [Aestuariivirga litoralis]|uniref:tetratricopeptide repeat protein n=1 Tax=Aestuariivirga litoralis TaxID=2650924 RepID=UPI0018C568C9|nr:tetratricopeptide repeat protein [Aestuariivirga litoralis]MBG1231543.1 sel1 repeat family protein [Aestuariivirga litoralis]
MKYLIAILMVFALAAAPVGSAFAVDQLLADLPFKKKLQLAKAGDVEAKMAVAEAYEKGAGTKLSASEAARWYREAALNGNLDAQYRLAQLVMRGAAGVKIDKATGIKLIAAAAQKGHMLSENQYGAILENGDGLPKDEKQAGVWYLKAAEQGMAEAQNNYGVMVLRGLGRERNLDEAFKWFTKAADQKYGWALNNLGGMYEKGWGTTADMAKAVSLYKLAGERGVGAGQKNFERLQAKQGSTTGSTSGVGN